MKNGVAIFLRDDEKVFLKERAKELGIPMSAYVRELILNIDYIKEKPKLELLYHINEELMKHLNRIGNNINQIAYALNSGISKDAGSIQKEFKDLKELLKEHKTILKQSIQFKLLKESKKEAINE